MLLQALHSFKLGDLASVTERLLGISFVNHHKEYGSIKKVAAIWSQLHNIAFFILLHILNLKSLQVNLEI